MKQKQTHRHRKGTHSYQRGARDAMVSRVFAIASQNQGLRPPDAGSIRRTQLASSRGACVVQLGAHMPAHLLQESFCWKSSLHRRDAERACPTAFP